MHRFKTKNKKAFTIIEVLIATGVLSVVFLTSLSLVNAHRIQKQKSKEMAIMNNFATQYIETLRVSNFADIKYGTAINRLYNGTNGMPAISTPANSNTWVSLKSTNYLTFNPELAWFKSRNPEYKLLIENSAGQLPSNIAKAHIQIDIRWDAPLKRGPKQTLRYDTMVYSQFR